ncbi:hypothetical protein COCON_G00215050 [Conger conger]|uniref:Fanconi anaemia group A protein C-terminal domain-containing protein n=1 Tax=Conger conger TaxID=82655 RepID=A0A9Q1CXV0_CONCO|nr:hypothetical protein COCON_G00215050 [Conger conger]
MRCDWPSQAANEALSQMHLQCPLLLVSAGCWWARLGPVLVSLWRRLSEDPLPEEIMRLADSYTWACSVVRAESQPWPSAPPLLLAACLHHAGGRSLSAALGQLGRQRQERAHAAQVLVFLLFFFITDLLSALLQNQDESVESAQGVCVQILSRLEDCTDWLPLFQPPGPEQGSCREVTMVTTDRHLRLMPLGFYSVVPHLDGEVLGRLARAPGFLLSAVRCYSALNALFLDGYTPVPPADPLPNQVDPLRIMARARQALFRIIALSPDASVSHSVRRQLQEVCGDLDPEVSAALSSHLAPPSPDPALQELDFL